MSIELSSQEQELLTILRQKNPPEFWLTITFKEDRWYVHLLAPQTSRQRTEGDGDTFGEAWDRIKPAWG